MSQSWKFTFSLKHSLLNFAHIKACTHIITSAARASLETRGKCEHKEFNCWKFSGQQGVNSNYSPKSDGKPRWSPGQGPELTLSGKDLMYEQWQVPRDFEDFFIAKSSWTTRLNWNCFHACKDHGSGRALSLIQRKPWKGGRTCSMLIGLWCKNSLSPLFQTSLFFAGLKWS